MKTENKLILAVFGCPGCATPSLHSFLHALPKWLEVNLFLAALAAWIHLFITFDGIVQSALRSVFTFIWSESKLETFPRFRWNFLRTF